MFSYQPSLDFARQIDREDSLRAFRDQFFIPENTAYFCGNSLGLQPRGVEQALLDELEQWRTHAVEGHFRGKMPWMYYHHFLAPQTARLVGALEEEVVVMNTLTTNLHLLLVSFYRPSAHRYKIIMEAGAFPSDQYALESQARFHGLDPDKAIVEVAPRPGEETLRTEDILETIRREGEQTALVLFGGVNYLTGQFFDMQAITRAGHEVGANVGFDLAHTAGNLPLRLHDWGPDFACWCSYKYLNSGPGGPGGVFVHERHADRPELPRFAGWWGHDEKSRFLMQKGFIPMCGAAGWQLSNAQILSFAAHKVSLDIFDEAGIQNLRAKSIRLTGYLEYLLRQIDLESKGLRLITPADPEQRGCQLSLLTSHTGKELFEYLNQRGFLCDWREHPGGGGIIRVAPTPLYNTFEEVWQLSKAL